MKGGSAGRLFEVVLIALISALFQNSANAGFTIHHTDMTTQPVPIYPPSLTYRFDSYYQDQSGVWHGDQIDFSLLGGLITASCRVQLSMDVWDANLTPDTVQIAVKQSFMGVAPPPGFPSNSAICSSMSTSHNNGQPAGPNFPASVDGAWGFEATAAQINNPPFMTNFYNVQLSTDFGGCGGGAGNGGAIQATYDNNGAGVRVTFDFNTIFNPASPLNCGINGKLYSVDGVGSVGIIDNISNP